MPSLLHPCRTCGHNTMDECWTVAKRIPSKERRICLDCHDDCLPKGQEHVARPYRTPP